MNIAVEHPVEHPVEHLVEHLISMHPGSGVSSSRGQRVADCALEHPPTDYQIAEARKKKLKLSEMVSLNCFESLIS